jgi:hypothetical protein
MHQGLYTAANIHQKMLANLRNITPVYKELAPDIPPMMGLAVGTQAASYGPPDNIVSSGEDVMQMFFGNDLGFTSKSIN